MHKKEHDTLSHEHGALEKKYDYVLNEKESCMKELETIKIENEDLKKKVSSSYKLFEKFKIGIKKIRYDVCISKKWS